MTAPSAIDPLTAMGMTMLRSSYSSLEIIQVALTTNGPLISVGLPDGFAEGVECFRSSSLTTGAWSVASSVLTASGTNIVSWTDTCASLSNGFYTIGVAADHDADGLWSGREVLVWDTEPFDADSDNDGATDGYEVLVLESDPNASNDPIQGSFALVIQHPATGTILN